jgi:hypothetical protein
MNGEYLREGEVAEDHFEAKDNGQRKHLLSHMPVELKQAASSNSPGTISHPADEPQYVGLLLGRQSECSARRRNRVARSNGSTQAELAKGTAESARKARKAYKKDVCKDQL